MVQPSIVRAARARQADCYTLTVRSQHDTGRGGETSADDIADQPPVQKSGNLFTLKRIENQFFFVFFGIITPFLISSSFGNLSEKCHECVTLKVKLFIQLSTNQQTFLYSAS